MKLKVNNQEICTEADTLSGLATELSWPSRGVAVAVNQCMVPRTKWDDFILNPDKYINQAYDKRFAEVAAKIRIRNLR